MKTSLTIFLVLLCGFPLLTQDLIYVSKAPGNGYKTEMTVENGHTLYGIAKAIGTDVSTIKSINAKDDIILTVNTPLYIPINSRSIYSSPTGLINARLIYYIVEKGDNLFRIASTVNLSTNDVANLNAKATHDLSIGERLLLGWIDWPFDKKHTELNIEKKNNVDLAQIRSLQFVPTPLTHLTLKQAPPLLAEINTEQGPPTIVKEKGIAFWDKGDKVTNELVVMHPHARINSKISLYNPMLNRLVQATVVSELPSQSYAKDISVVISPSVANALGALDKRFLVEITYAE